MMPLPASLEPFLKTRRFWTDFLWETEPSLSPGEEPPYPELHDCRIDLPVADGFELRLSLDEGLDSFELDFVAPGRDAVNIAWDDQAHWHPHVLRWEELETIGRAIAIRDPELSHPGHVVLLLHRFAPICRGDDLGAVVSTLEAAWKQLGLFTEGEITNWIERIDARAAGFRWRRRRSLGWVIEQGRTVDSAKELYSLRRGGKGPFPFADWNRMIEAAEQEVGQLGSLDRTIAAEFAETGRPELVLEIAHALREQGHEPLAASIGRNPSLPQAFWVAETILGLPAGSLAAKHAPPACRPRRQWPLELRIPHQDADRPVPVPFSKLFRDTLDRILRSLDLGSTDSSGALSMQNADGTFAHIESMHSTLIKGNLDEGLRILRDALWWSSAPQSVRLTKAGGAEIPLALDQPPAESAPIVLQLGALETVRWSNGHRFDRAPLGVTAQERLKQALSQWRALGPDEAGWSRIATQDGGQLEIQADRSDDDPDGITIVFRRLSPETASLTHQLMSEGSCMLLPPLLAPNADVAGQVSAPWPAVRVVESPNALYEILSAGPHSWWTGEHRA